MLYIAAAVAREWCAKHGVSARDMHGALVTAGIADKEIKRKYLGRGTYQYSNVAGPIKVWEINPSAMRSVIGDTPLADILSGSISGDADAGAGAGSRNSAA